MRIVDRETFMKLPAGTIYAKIPQPIIINGLSVKADTITAHDGRAIDWATLSIADWQSEGSGDWADRYYLMSEENVSVPVSDMYGRDGMFEDSDKFLVFEKADLFSLRNIIDDALKLPEMSAPSRALEHMD